MSGYPDLLILRHGETEWNRIERMQGGLDSPLTDTGRAQAMAQNTIVRHFGVRGWTWFSSPQGRARETARIVGDGLQASIALDDRLSEIRLGDWDGLFRHDIRAQAPHLFDDPDAMIWYDHAPGGEGLSGLETRVHSFLSDLTQPSVIVTHGITSRVMRCILMGLPTSAFDQLPGGQGVVYHLAQGVQKQLSLGA